MIAHYQISRSLIDRVWRKVKHSQNVYRMLDARSYPDIVSRFMGSEAAFEYPFGVIRFTRREKRLYVHGIFWGKDVFRSIKEMKEDISRFALTNGFREIYCEFPTDARAVRSILERGGFMPFEKGIFYVNNRDYVPTDIYVLQLY